MNLKRTVFRSLFGWFARQGWVTPFVWILKRAIYEHPESRKFADSNRPTVLGLSPEHFRGDLDFLAESGTLRVLIIPSQWQTRLMFLFFPEGYVHWEYQNPPAESGLVGCKRDLQAFYRKLLPRLYRELGIDAVISHHVRVSPDVDWGIASKETGYPYLIFYREGLFGTSTEIKRRLTDRLLQLGCSSSHMIVHNDSCRDFLIDIGLVPPDEISALGCLRMDAYVRRVAGQSSGPAEKRDGARPMIACFPFRVGGAAGLLNESFEPVFRDAHVPLLELARDRPDVDVIFKPKDKILDGFREDLELAASEAGLDLAALDNVTITADWNAQDLIMTADVITGINTTTIMEAALVPKPVVVPFFTELRELPMVDCIKFVDALMSLDCADDAADLRRLLERGLEGHRPDEAAMERRRRFFSKYISDPDGNALAHYEALVLKVINEARDERKRQNEAA